MIRTFLAVVLTFLSLGLSAQQETIVRPMLNNDVAIPNGGIFRTWTGNLSDIKTINVFSESPYKNLSNIIYTRIDWCTLEKAKGKYSFDYIESLMKKSLKNHQRLILGLSNMSIAKSSTHIQYDGKQICTPTYVYDKLSKSQYPFFKDEIYCKDGYSPDYRSPYLLKRYKALLSAFAKWIEGDVEGTSVKRKDVIYGIETRYLGYWGEGSMNGKYYPEDYRVLDAYLNLYNSLFPDILLIGGAHETIHCPNYRGEDLSKYSAKELSAMRHVYHLLNMKNEYGRAGLFIDSWNSSSNQYDSISKRVVLDDNNKVLFLYPYLRDHVYGKVYMTGEFDYFTRNSDSNLLPYVNLGQQFRARHTSGITLSNMNAHDAEKFAARKQEIYDNTKKVMAFTGYRIVLDNVKLTGNSLSFMLTNIGESKIFHDYYQLHLLIKNENGDIIKDAPTNFDFRTLDYNSAAAVQYGRTVGKRLTFQLPKVAGSVFIIIKDKKNIEYPMTLSNYGRQKDGSYFLIKLR